MRFSANADSNKPGRSLISIVLPIHFTHKALRTSSPPYLAPWLMYWSILSLFLLCESYVPLISWLPLYSTARLFFLTWLVLPQTQGATYLYQIYIGPFLIENETKIDNAISDAHRRAKAAGGDFFVKAVEWIQSTVFGREAVRQEQAPGENYAQGLIRRFTIPVPGFPAPTTSGNDLSGLLASFTSTLGLNAALSHSGTARDAQISALSSEANLIPPSLKSVSDRAAFVKQQRERVRVLLGALDKEAINLDTQHELERRIGSGPGGLNKSRSEVNFEVVERPSSRDIHSDDSTGKNKPAKSSWLSGWWPAAGEKAIDGSVSAPDSAPKAGEQRAFSSGVEL